jgi:DNA-binding NarL/FixJ family response regulator
MDVASPQASSVGTHPMAKVCVSILSSDRIFGEGLRRILATDAALTVVALTEQLPATAAVRVVGSDVLLVDARMQGALAFCDRAKQDGGPGIILVAVPDDDASAASALSAGARGILQTSAHSDDVAKAVHVVANGQVWAPRRVIVAAWLGEMKRERPDPRPPVRRDPRLTTREMEVLHHAAAGRGNKEMASDLAISEATVKAHLTRIFQKLGLQGRAQLAAAYHGIVPPTAAPAAVRDVVASIERRTTFRHVVRRQAN